QPGDDLLRQEFEDLPVAEEARDIDKQVLAEKLYLAGVLLKHLEIAVAVGNSGHRHAPLDAALQRTWLVEREVMRCLRAQKLDDRGKSALRLGAVRNGRAGRGLQVHLTAVSGENLRNLRHRQHEIDRARGDRASRHAVVAGVTWILRDDEPALLLDGLQSEAAVRAGTRQNHADR